MRCLHRVGHVALLASCLVPACERGSYFGTIKPHHEPSELWINNGGEPEWIDPGKCADAVGGEIIFNIFAGLTQPHPQTLQPMPDVAESWERSKDGLIYTFHLRRSTWSDGTPLTARDFVWSWKRVLNPATASKYASLLFVIKGAEAYNQGKGSADAVGLRAIDAQTLEVHLSEPVPYFLALTHHYTLMPVPKHVISGLIEAGKSPDLWTRPQYIVSNGAYTLKEWHFRQMMLLEKNPRYWDATSVRLAHIRVSEVESNNTALNLYRTGELDSIGTNTALPSEFLGELKHFGDFHHSPYLTVYWYWLNTKRPPLDDVRVRRALSLAIDRRAITAYIKRGGETPMANLVPDGLAGYRAPEAPLFAPGQARQLLAAAGYPQGRSFPTLALSYNTAEGHKQIAEAIQQMWKENLGINVRLENQEWKVFLSNVENDNFDIARLGWTGDFADPYTFLEVLSGTSGNNHSGWSDPEYDKLLAAANAEANPAMRLALLRQAEELLLAAQPLLPIYLYTRSYMLKPYVMGVWKNFLDRHPFKWMWIDKRWYDEVPHERLSAPPPPAPTAEVLH